MKNKIKTITELVEATEKMWKDTIEAYTRRGIQVDDPSGEKPFGGNYYNDLLNRMRLSMLEEQNGYLVTILYETESLKGADKK